MTERYSVETVDAPIDARIRPPGSKSITIRALAAAAMAEGRSHLYGALVADDTEAMTGALRGLGTGINDGSEPWAVDGTGGHVQSVGGVIDVNESGLSARIILMMAAFSETSTTITGRGRLLQRPIDSIVATSRLIVPRAASSQRLSWWSPR
jgi:3-phosphoshikimate 1-carboxyvinyltransferase